MLKIDRTKPFCPACSRDSLVFVAHRTAKHDPQITTWECIDTRRHTGGYYFRFLTQAPGLTILPTEFLEKARQTSHPFEAAGGTVFPGGTVRFLCGLCRLDLDADVHTAELERLEQDEKS